MPAYGFAGHAVNAGRVLTLLGREAQVGPRSPLLLWIVVVPLIATVIVRVVFGGLFERQPSLGIVDQGSSALTTAAQQLEGMEVSILDDAERLRDEVLAHDLDAGWVLPPGFDAAVQAGRRPPLELLLSGESVAADRVVIGIAVLNLVRTLQSDEAVVSVAVEPVGEGESLPLSTRLLPLLVIAAVAVAGAFVPAAGLVEEKQAGTLVAVLTTPATLGEILLAKGILGVVLGVGTGVATLALNGAFGAAPFGLVVALVIGAVMMAEIGLVLGAWARTTSTLFTAYKGGALLLVFPAVFALVPGLPGWVAKLGPTYWFLHPVYALSVEDATFRALAPELAVGVGICVLLAVVLRPVAGWLTRQVTV